MLRRQKATLIRLWLRTGLTLGLMFSLGLCTVFAQTATLRGKVTDAQTGEVLPQANVQVTAPGVQTGATSNLDGTYEVPNLAAGTYTVTVSYVGYDPKVIANVAVAAGETKVLNIALTGTGVVLNPVVTTASRRQEKALDAPASVSVLEATQIRGRPATTPTDYLRGLPAVDISTNGIAQSNVVVRGFNNIFSGALLSLTDNRYAHVPSLRLNAYNFVPLTGEDIARIEVVLGPGSALYGPNSTSGVMHIITRSPFESEGTSISVGGGGRDFVNFARTDPNGGRNIYMASARHARRFSDKVGFKISAQYYQGRDWESYLPVDVAPRKIQFGKQTATGRIAQGDSVINQGDFNVEKIAGEARLDFRLSDDATLIFNGGYNQADQIELTGIGAGQAKDWKYIYGQARFNYKNLFVQGFINASDAGDTYILRTGDLIVDNSKLYVGQAQHSLSLGERQRFTYGVDAIFTRPNTKNTIHGRNEGKNQIDELGAYLQSETKVFSKLDLVAAARVDDHNHIKDPVFSPRAALVFKPSTDHTFRLTYNRAFSTPTSNNLFLDLRQENRSNPFFPLNQPIPTLNLNPNIVVIQARGVPSSTGFTFRHGLDGRAQMYSQFDQIDGYADATLNNVWTKLRTILVASNPALGSVLPPTLTRTIPLVFLNPATGQPVTEVKNVESIEPTIHNNFEIGYRGIISNKLLFTVDVYRAHIENFVSDIGSINYTTHAVRPVAGALLIEEMVDRGIPRPVAEGVVNQLFDPASPNNLARAPLGVITPEQVLSDVEITASYRNFGNIWLTGSDLSFTYYATQNWNFSGNYSYVNHDIFRNVDGIQDVALNAPQHKAGLSIQYRAPKRGYEAELRSRYIEGFPMDSGDYRGEVQTYTLVDFNFGYDLPFSSGTRLSLNVQNIFDNRHREFIGAPILGRLIMTRLTQTF